MKNIKIIFSMLILMALGLGSCNEDLAEPPVPMPEGGIGNGEWNSPAGVYQVINGYNNTSLDECWVHGYIVGTVNTSDATGYVLNDVTADFTVPTSVNSNLMLAYTPDEKDWRNCMTVQIQDDVRNALNLKDHPKNLGKEVCIRGSLDEKYFGAYALKSTTAYNWGNKGVAGALVDDPNVPEGSVTVWSKTLKNINTGFTFSQGEPETPGFETWKYNEKFGLVATGGNSDKGLAIATDAMAISQEINLANFTQPRLQIHQAANYFKSVDNFKKTCSTLISEAGSDNWEVIEFPQQPTGTSFTYSDSGYANLDAYAGKKIKIAFRYTSTTELSGTWEIDKVTLTGISAN